MVCEGCKIMDGNQPFCNVLMKPLCQKCRSDKKWHMVGVTFVKAWQGLSLAKLAEQNITVGEGYSNKKLCQERLTLDLPFVFEQRNEKKDRLLASLNSRIDYHSQDNCKWLNKIISDVSRLDCAIYASDMFTSMLALDQYWRIVSLDDNETTKTYMIRKRELKTICKYYIICNCPKKLVYNEHSENKFNYSTLTIQDILTNIEF